jgi:hypothetical protein
VHLRTLLLVSSFSLLWVAPLRATEPQPDRRFGAMTHFAHGWDPVWADIAAIRAVHSVRDELYWNAVEREKGVFAFPRQFDLYMDALRRNDVEPLIVLSFENDNYDQGNTPWSTEAFDAFGRYGTEVLKHYGTQIRALEIWNEYNGTFCKGPATQDRAGTYPKMLRAAYAQIKALRPDVTVLGGATAGVPLPYWEKLMQQGALDAMDALSIHPYRYENAPEGIEADIAALQSLVKKYNHGETKPIWVTEIGWGTHAAAPGGIAIDEATQAKFLVRAYALLLSANVERVYWYLFRDDEDFTMGLTTADATPKLASYAMQVMAIELGGARFVRREETLPEVYSILFVRPSGEEVRVLWSLSPLTVPVAGVTKVVDLLGGMRFAPTELALTDTPVFVAGPLVGLPPSPVDVATTIAKSSTDFSGEQGGGNWWYGSCVGGAFDELSSYSVSDWNAAWGGGYPFLAITANDQHPSVAADGRPVAAVRRWRSDRAGTVRIKGNFQCSTNGDGVGVSIRVNGQPLFRKLLGGGQSVQDTFDFEQIVEQGTSIDFAVDPGPGSSIDFDATQVSVEIAGR